MTDRPVRSSIPVGSALAGFIGFAAAGPALQLAGPSPVFAAIAVLAAGGAAMFVLGLRVTPDASYASA
jgi:hypothetical protein